MVTKMSKNKVFMARFGSAKRAGSIIDGDDEYLHHTALKNPLLSSEHINKVLTSPKFDAHSKDAALEHPNTPSDVVYAEIDKRLKSNKNVYSTEALITRAKSLKPEHLSSLMKHEKESTAVAAYNNPNAPHREGMTSKHDTVKNKAYTGHATDEELMHLAKHGDVHDKITAITAKNTKPHHIDEVIKHMPKVEEGKTDFEAKHLAFNVGNAMVKHDHIVDLPEHARGKYTINIENHERAASVHLDKFKKLQRNFKISLPTVDHYNVGDILTSHAPHANAALMSKSIFGDVNQKYDNSHGIVLHHPGITDDTLRHVGTITAKDHSNNSVALAAAMHPNASSETKKAIADTAEQANHPHAKQLRAIHERSVK